MKTGALLLLVLVSLLAGCGGSSSEGGTLTQAGEPSAGERGNLLLDTEVATYNLCIDLGIEPCGNEAGSVETTNTFIAQVEQIATDNQLKAAAVAASLSDAVAELDGACGECKKILDAKIATLK
jgi:hypothetical protein